MSTPIWELCDTIEECYEFMLGYAAKGLPTDQGDRPGGQIREFLYRAATAMAALVKSCSLTVNQEGLEPAEKYQAFIAVLERDARDSLAAVELVLAQPAISSQLVDNLNASIHLRALLTDLFLVGDVLKSAAGAKAER